MHKYLKGLSYPAMARGSRLHMSTVLRFTYSNSGHCQYRAGSSFVDGYFPRRSPAYETVWQFHCASPIHWTNVHRTLVWRAFHCKGHTIDGNVQERKDSVAMEGMWQFFFNNKLYIQPRNLMLWPILRKKREVQQTSRGTKRSVHANLPLHLRKKFVWGCVPWEFNARFRRRTWHELNRMLTRENKGFFSFAFDSTYVKYGTWTWPEKTAMVRATSLNKEFNE